MKRLHPALALVIVPAIWLVSFRRAEACGRCLDMTPLHDTARRAGLVAVLVRLDRKIKYGPRSWTEDYEVLEVLKGAARVHSIISVASSMCDANVHGEPGHPILAFLERYEGVYGGAGGGCAVGSLPIDSGVVMVDRLEVDVHGLALALGLEPKARAAREEVSPFWWPLAPAGGGLLALLVAFKLGQVHPRRS